eukprot:GABV01009194.1.p1 GENE.GABV01009194.1~~GABV01009194.1.p1  ORF type:complete len:235 (+),score=42.73 GABV01009194.1:36-707(+)
MPGVVFALIACVFQLKGVWCLENTEASALEKAQTFLKIRSNRIHQESHENIAFDASAALDLQTWDGSWLSLRERDIKARWEVLHESAALTQWLEAQSSPTEALSIASLESLTFISTASTWKMDITKGSFLLSKAGFPFLPLAKRLKQQLALLQQMQEKGLGHVLELDPTGHTSTKPTFKRRFPLPEMIKKHLLWKWSSVCLTQAICPRMKRFSLFFRGSGLRM